MSTLIVTTIEDQIHLIRGPRVMLSPDLALLYEVEPRALIQAVKRNIERFPKDFMFQLNKEETQALKISSSWGGARRTTPYAFTEQGIAMLSGVLKSSRAIKVNIIIMRAFVKLRELLSTNKELAYKLTELEHSVGKHDEAIQAIFEAIKQLLHPVPEPREPIGYKLKS